jgi:hypothetical protein
MLAPLQRYIGVAIGIAAGIVILVENRKSIRKLLRDGFVLGIASLLPIAWWLLVHNIMTYGSLWGVGPQVSDVGANISLSLTKMLHWFVPYLTFLMPILIRPWIPLGAAALLLVIINRKSKENGRSWLQSFTSPLTYPTVVYAIVYFVILALTIVTADHRDLFSDRYYVILLVPTAILLLVTIDKLIAPHLNLSSQQMQVRLILIFALWSIYPLYSFREYLIEAQEQGEPSGANMFNNRAYHEMSIIPEMQKIRREQPDQTFYSNYSDAVWFYTQKPVSPSLIANDDSVAASIGWPFDKPGYIIWFEPNEYKHYLPPEKIAEFANVELIYEGTGGKIYYVKAR